MRRALLSLPLAAALALVPALLHAAADLRGVVIRVVDGDSLWIRPDGGGRPVQLRLSGIDAPEICQPQGARSHAALAALVLHKPVQVVVQGRDGYGRTLGRVQVDGTEVNRRLVEQGQAWSLRNRWGGGPYLDAERRAAAQRRGVHEAGPARERPWDFRRRHGPCAAPR